MQIKMIESRFEAGGAPRLAGQSYDAPLEQALQWIGDGVATASRAAREAVQGTYMQDVRLNASGSLVTVGGKSMLLADIAGAATPDAILTKGGRVLQSLTSPTQTVGLTSVTHELSLDRPWHSPFTRKITFTANNPAQIRFPNLNVVPDASDRAICIPVDIVQIPNVHIQAPNHQYLTVLLTNETTVGANTRAYVFDASCLRQGRNHLKMRSADVNNTKTDGNMALGSSWTNSGTGLDWTQPIRAITIDGRQLNGYTMYVDDVRQPARARTIFVIGFDANLPIMETHVAPLLKKHGMKAYTTFTGVYEEASRGETWERMKRLQSEYGWDIINHTWSHGATSVGRSQPITLSRTGGVVTGVMGGAHGLTLGAQFRTRIVDAPTTDLNGLVNAYATNATNITYSAPGANVASETASIRTVLDAVLDTDTPEGRHILRYEIGATQDAMRAAGLDRQPGAIIWPNNSAPDLTMTRDICREFGIVIGRGMRRGYTSVDEFGIDNPLHCGSQDMDSGNSSYTRLSGMRARVRGAIERGEHCQVYGHYLQLIAEAGAPVDPDFPPGQGGNPAPPAGALSGAGGWWYFESFATLIEEEIAPAVRRGDALCMTPSEYARFMGLSRG